MGDSHFKILTCMRKKPFSKENERISNASEPFENTKYEERLYIKKRKWRFNMLPKEPTILLSMINMKLRDQYSSLDALCDDMDESKAEIEEILAKAGYKYNPDSNQFR